MTLEANYHLTFVDDGEETLTGVVFFGLHEGNLLFVQPGSVRREEPTDLPPVAPETVRMSDHWQSEGSESVEVISYALDELASITADWSALHPVDNNGSA